MVLNVLGFIFSSSSGAVSSTLISTVVGTMSSSMMADDVAAVLLPHISAALMYKGWSNVTLQTCKPSFSH